jgi:predicted NodU family carbamoyl transferase
MLWETGVRLAKEVAGLPMRAVAEFGVYVLPGPHEWNRKLRKAFHAMDANVRAAAWIGCHHHRAHALSGWFESPFAKPLILSTDGGGSDGTFHTFLADSASGLTALPKGILRVPQGAIYQRVGGCCNEVTGRKAPLRFRGTIDVPGKLMAYEALGVFRPEWFKAISAVYNGEAKLSSHDSPADVTEYLARTLGLQLDADGELLQADARDVAATNEHAFHLSILDR